MLKSIGRTLLWLLTLILATAGLFSLYLFASLPDVSALARTNPEITALMDERAAEAREERRAIPRQRIWVPLSRISPHLLRAVISSEDASFFFHDGFDWEGIKEAAWRNVGAGKLERGGSTITQQLAKNLYLSTDKTITRKLKEAVLTRLLEHDLSKKRILELYLNVVEWGDGVYGAEAAARHHFGKSARDLTAHEAALLAAILPSPRQNDPLKRTPYLAKRQEQILRWMSRQGDLGLGKLGRTTSRTREK